MAAGAGLLIAAVSVGGAAFLYSGHYNVRTAFGEVGPLLRTFGRHVYFAGELPDQPSTLVRFIQDPRDLVPGTAMPDLAGWTAGAQAIKPGNLTPPMQVFDDDELRALASYLESLK